MNNVINIISPCLRTKTKSFNISVNNTNTHIVSYDETDDYTVTNKDGSVPDINISEQTLDKLIEARRVKNILSAVIEYLENTDDYNEAIFDDRQVLMEITNMIAVDTPSPEFFVPYIIEKCESARKYRLKSNG